MASDYLPDPDVYDVFDLGMDVTSVGPAPCRHTLADRADRLPSGPSSQAPPRKNHHDRLFHKDIHTASAGGGDVFVFAMMMLLTVIWHCNGFVPLTQGALLRVACYVSP